MYNFLYDLLQGVDINLGCSPNKSQDIISLLQPRLNPFMSTDESVHDCNATMCLGILLKYTNGD